MKTMNSGIVDKHGIEVKVGDTICMPYITPLGKLTEDVDFEAEVVFQFGCFGYWDATEFIPLIKWMFKGKGEYVSNYGNKVVYTEEYIFWVKTK